jgi:hypothetical protein
MPKRRSIIPLNREADAFALFTQLMPVATDVRGERIAFDAGSFAHLAGDEERLERIGWIAETLTNPLEIRRDYDRRFPFREIYFNVVFQSEDDQDGEGFVVVVDRRVTLNFWTAFVCGPRCQAQVRKGKLLWSAEPP